MTWNLAYSVSTGAVDSRRQRGLRAAPAVYEGMTLRLFSGVRFHVWAVGCMLVAGLGAFAGRAAASEVPGPPIEVPAADALRPEERAFLIRAGELSGHEIRLGRLAVAQASSSELREFGQQLAGDQQQIADSIANLRRQKGSTVAAAAQPLLSESYERLAQLSGGGFDREFVRVLAEMHRSLLTLFEEATADAKDPEVRALAGGALPMLRDHNNRLTEFTKVLN